MKEWAKKNWFNSFNSAKGLLYQDHYKAIIAKDFLPPIEASLDPIHACNLLCDHCNAHRYLLDSYEMKSRRMENIYLMTLIEFLAKWGVKAICYGGGGEPTLHDALPMSLLATKVNSMESSVATNGTIWSNELISSMAETCKWVGVSVDAATSKTYEIGRKQNYFNQVLKNIRALIALIANQSNTCSIAYKFLIFSHNQHEIYDACKIAKDLGVRDFHARFADFSHQGMGPQRMKTLDLDKDKILEQFEQCHELEDKDRDKFRVFTVMHKFDEDLIPLKNFTQCYAAPLTIQLCADGKVYHCVDQRHKPEYILGQHAPNSYNILTFWGKERHQKLVFDNTPKKCNTRCTYGVYNKQCEELFSVNKDPMCRNFP